MKTMTFRRFATRLGAVALCSAALCAAPMLAQGGGGGGRGPQMTPDQQTDALDKAVTLTPDQKTKVLAMYTADAKKLADLRAAQDPDMRTKNQAIRTDEQTQIKGWLTADQNTKYTAYLAAMPQGRGGGGRGAGGGGGGGMGGGGAPPPQM